jgi:hypothetical protein
MEVVDVHTSSGQQHVMHQQHRNVALQGCTLKGKL